MTAKISLLAHFLLGLLFLIPLSATSQTRCAAEVSYNWQPAHGESDASGGKDVKSAEKKSELVFFGNVEGFGESEEVAKENLAKRLALEKEKALDDCRAAHENNASCVAAKYTAMGAILQTLDFKARNELRESIVHDCKMQSGRCIDAISSDPKCKQQVTEQKDAAVEAGKAGEAVKEEKGKKPAASGKKK